MSTRQHRFNTQDQIRKRLAEFTGKKINIVLNDQTVHLARVEQVVDTVVKVSNMRLKTFSIPIDTITEIYFDTKE
jgi:hypothetical protein